MAVNLGHGGVALPEAGLGARHHLGDGAGVSLEHLGDHAVGSRFLGALAGRFLFGTHSPSFLITRASIIPAAMYSAARSR